MSSGDCAFLFLTDACNLRCAHCYVDSGPRVGREMSPEVLSAALRLLGEIGIQDIRLTGGEATTHSRFREIVTDLHTAGFKPGLVTNGIRLFKDETDVALWNMLARCWVSLYGVTAASHRRVSGRPERTFIETIAHVGAVARQGYWIGLSVLLSPGESCDVEGLVLRVESAGITRLRFLPLDPDGRARTVENSPWASWPREIAEVARILKSCAGPNFTNLSLNDPFDLDGQFESPDRSCLLRSRRMWSVVSDGSIYPCCFNVTSPMTRIGNVLDPNIGDVMLRHVGRQPRCRGLAKRFWLDAVDGPVTCPIRSVDPRAIQ